MRWYIHMCVCVYVFYVPHDDATYVMRADVRRVLRMVCVLTRTAMHFLHRVHALENVRRAVGDTVHVFQLLQTAIFVFKYMSKYRLCTTHVGPGSCHAGFIPVPPDTLPHRGHCTPHGHPP